MSLLTRTVAWRLLGFCLGLITTSSVFGATVPAGITKTVVFIYTDAAAQHADGTGFLVSVPVAAHPDQQWVYLVTAKHVLHTNGNDFNSPLYSRLFVRL